MTEVAEADVLARIDDGDRSVRVERVRFTAADGRPRNLVTIAVYERLFRGGWACRRRVTLRRAELGRVIEGLSRVTSA